MITPDESALLETRCTHCRGTFAITRHQLSQHEGLARCGKCHQVFDARENIRVLSEQEVALERLRQQRLAAQKKQASEPTFSIFPDDASISVPVNQLKQKSQSSQVGRIAGQSGELTGQNNGQNSGQITRQGTNPARQSTNAPAAQSAAEMDAATRQKIALAQMQMFMQNQDNSKPSSGGSRLRWWLGSAIVLLVLFALASPLFIKALRPHNANIPPALLDNAMQPATPMNAPENVNHTTTTTSTFSPTPAESTSSFPATTPPEYRPNEGIEPNAAPSDRQPANLRRAESRPFEQSDPQNIHESDRIAPAPHESPAADNAPDNASAPTDNRAVSEPQPSAESNNGQPAEDARQR